MFGGGEEYTSSAAEYIPSGSKKKKGCKNKRRFSDEQVRSLETMFESETKLEPRKKLQLAKELGLQPRQVAIWFQNKRARWKSKQLEREYSILLSSYNTLSSQFESLKKEKQSLVLQLQKLNDLMENSQKESQCCRQENDGNTSDRDSDNGESAKTSEIDANTNISLDRIDHGIGMLSDDVSSMRADMLGLDEDTDLLNMVEPAGSSLTSPENWPGGLDSDGLLDEPSSSYQWWDFWA